MNQILIYLISIISALIVTIVIEAVIAYLKGITNKYGLIVILLINIVTNTTLNIVLTVLSNVISNLIVNYSILLVFEVIVVILEALAMKKFIKQKMNFFYISFLINFFSFVVGTGLVNRIVELI